MPTRRAVQSISLDAGILDQFAHRDRKSTRLNSSHSQISYAVFCLKKKKKTTSTSQRRPHQNMTLTVRPPASRGCYTPSLGNPHESGSPGPVESLCSTQAIVCGFDL